MVTDWHPSKLYDVLIIGGGPAGLATALGLGRVNRTALVFDSGLYRNAGVHAFHYFPSRDGMNPSEFRNITRDQIKNKYHSIEFRASDIVSARRVDIKQAAGWSNEYLGFEVADATGQTWRSRKLVLATGSRDILPDIEGYADNWPEHIYQCLFCDGFEVKGKPVGILGFTSPMYAHFVLMAYAFSDDITIYSNGPISEAEDIQKALRMAKARGAKLDERRIKSLINEGRAPEHGIKIEFEDGHSATLGFLAHKPPTVNRAQKLIDQLGLERKPNEQGGEIVVKDASFQKTSLAGCYVAGDTCTMLKSVVGAASAGIGAAGGVNMELCGEEGQRALSGLDAQ